MRTVAVVQARFRSARLPGKPLRPVDGARTLLDCVLDRLDEAPAGAGLAETAVATTTAPADDAIQDLCAARGVRVVRGDEDDVLGRFVQAASECRADAVVRVCADNPLLDPCLLTELADYFHARQPDYAAHLAAGGVPSICTPAGLFVECVATEALRRLAASGPAPDVAAHVTFGLYTDARYDCAWLAVPDWAERPWLRLTCDTAGDLERLRRIFAQAPVHGSRRELVDWLARRPDLTAAMEAENRRHPKPAIRIPAGQAFQPDKNGHPAGEPDLGT